MDREGGSNGSCYYSLLGIRKGASFSEIRCAYRKLALKWHPDRWGTNSKGAGEAKRRFQQIQEAYSVLSDQGKRSMYDAGLYDPFEEEEEGFSDFMEEMLSMMDNVRPGEESFEDLQKMFVEMASGGGGGGGGGDVVDRTTASGGKGGKRVSGGSQGNVSKKTNSRVSVSVSVSVSD
ncbi:DnaJ domain [Macleaya cordata]|uniref:DnaJ domain n=1 Tax=Macleaya cordata TaxID=56857 RepID=A0A200R2D1_MACCD|nr:DnaJ domain [Macleaya cordata]